MIQNQQTIEIINRQVEHLVRLVDDLLDISRVSNNKLELKKHVFRLSDMIAQVNEACSHLIRSKKQELKITLPQEAIFLNADLIRLIQVLVNLINNASKYTQDSGKINLQAGSEGSVLTICVSDNGPGLSSEMLPRVFDMFTQVSRSLEQKTGGLGIGLAISRRLIELHGGTINANSDGEGKGTTFTIKIPVITQEHPEHSGQHETTKSAENKKIRTLIVDDNIDAAVTLSLLLEMEGHETTLAHDGHEAVEKALELRPELILLDIGLPGMNGYDVCRKIRTNQHTADISIIALTGWGQEADKIKSKEAGFDFHITKPVDHNTLLQLIYKNINKKKEVI